MRDNYAGMTGMSCTNGINSVVNAFGYYGLTTLADIAGFVGRDSDQAALTARAIALKANINKHMWNGTAYCDGVCAKVPHTAFHSSARCSVLDRD